MAHPLLPFPSPAPRRSRGVRGSFTPSLPAGPYQLPRDVCDRLTSALAPFRNRDAAFALAVFLGRFWSTPARLLSAFPIDRRELAGHAALGLTEARIRGAIRTLEEIGFLDRAVASGSTHRPTPDGLHRKPVLFVFGSDYGPLFSAANSLDPTGDCLASAQTGPRACADGQAKEKPASGGSEAEAHVGAEEGPRSA